MPTYGFILKPLLLFYLGENPRRAESLVKAVDPREGARGYRPERLRKVTFSTSEC